MPPLRADSGQAGGQEAQGVGMTHLVAAPALSVDPNAGRLCIIGVRHFSYHRVQRHHLWPVGMGGSSSEAEADRGSIWEWTCGTHHDDIHDYLRRVLDAGQPDRIPGSVKRGYNAQVRELAIRGWALALADGTDQPVSG